MKVALCASEAVPFAKTGGLADVCGALPHALEELGVEVCLVMPKYSSVRSSGVLIKTFNQDFDVAVLGERSRAYFLKHDMYLRDGLYGDRLGDYADNLKRFAYFCKKSLELFQKLDFKPDVIHCHDWQTALIPVLLKANPEAYSFSKGKTPKTVLTIHNVSYQGIFPKEQMPETGLDNKYFSVSGLEFYDKINLLKGGIEFADMINTVSPQHVLEMQEPESGCGLEGVLRTRKDNFCGIINGIDYDVWNPQGDQHLFKNYSYSDLEGKKANKRKLQEFCRLDVIDDKPLLGFVGRLVEQKGIELIIRVLPRLCEQGIQAVILGRGEPKYEMALVSLIQQYPALISFSSHFDDELAHRIYAGSDIFLMPSKFEPCGMGQMIGFKYGSIPVVYKTGGLKDTVIDYSLKNAFGNGFVFHVYEEPEFFIALRRASELFNQKKKWQELVSRVMRLNFSWKESARKYVELYEKAIGE